MFRSKRGRKKQVFFLQALSASSCKKVIRFCDIHHSLNVSMSLLLRTWMLFVTISRHWKMEPMWMPRMIRDGQPWFGHSLRRVAMVWLYGHRSKFGNKKDTSYKNWDSILSVCRELHFGGRIRILNHTHTYTHVYEPYCKLSCIVSWLEVTFKQGFEGFSWKTIGDALKNDTPKTYM